MSVLDTSEAVTALIALHTETTMLIDRLGNGMHVADEILGEHTLRLRLAEHTARLAALVDPTGFLDELERSEMAAWIHDPTLYKRALYEDGPAQARRLLRAVEPAARLYVAVRAETAGTPS